MNDNTTPALELMADQDGERLDQFLARRLDGASRSQARRLIDDGLIRVDGALERPSYKLRFGELVATYPRQSIPVEAAADIKLDIVYEDDHLAVIDKQARLTVHPAPGETQATLIAAVLNQWPEMMADQDGERLDQFLARRLDGASRSQARRLIDDGLIRVDGALERPSYKLRFGELVATYPRQSIPVEAAADIKLDIVYEDDHLAVIDKQARLTVHPAPGETQATLIAAVLNQWPEVARIAEEDPESDPQRPGLVHRLDRDTTGLLMIAKNADALRSLQDQLRQRTMDKRYLAVVVGAPDPPAGLIDAAIGRDPSDPRRMAILDRARPSQTGYETVERFPDAALLECRLITGRTHQIRVHLSAIGHPIAGDTMYGFATPLIDRQALHARTLTIQHPVTDEPVTISAEPPADFRSLLSHLREGELLLGDQSIQPGRREPPDTVKRQHRSTRRNRRRKAQRIR